MQRTKKITTPYARFVFLNVPKAAGAGQGAYNYKELAEMVGLKPTQNFRRRVNELVDEGVLKLEAAFTPRGGIENRFSLKVTETIGEIPF